VNQIIVNSAVGFEKRRMDTDRHGNKKQNNTASLSFNPNGIVSSSRGLPRGYPGFTGKHFTTLKGLRPSPNRSNPVGLVVLFTACAKQCGGSTMQYRV
jgi:hypothetical protein